MRPLPLDAPAAYSPDDVQAMAVNAATVMGLLGIAAWHPDSWPDLDAVGDLLQNLRSAATAFPGSIDRILDRIHETRPGEDVASAIARAHLGSVMLLAAHHASALVDVLGMAQTAARAVTSPR